ncbi:unnamed protein product [Calypogeia fissa]
MSQLAGMALRSALLRIAAGRRRRPGGTQVMERIHSSLPYIFQTRSTPPPSSAPSVSSAVLLKDAYQDEHCISISSPATSETEPEPSISGRSSAVQLSFVASWDSPKLTHWFQIHGDISDPRVLGGILANSGTQMLGVSVLSGTLPGSGIGNADRKGCNWSSQVRRVSSSSWKLFPRKIEKPRYSGRPLDREDSGIHAQRQARFDGNFKRLPAVKLPLGEYRQKIVDNSTKNMALVPKKWKRALPSREVMDAVLYLRRAKTNKDEVKEVIRKRVARMLKLEMMLVLSELQRLDESFLAHQVFNAVRKESWYKPNVYLYQTMVETFGKSKQIKDAERMFEELQSEGLQPDDSIKRELLRAYVKCDMMTEAIKLYKEIQKSGPLDRAARSILFHGLNEEQKVELAAYEKARGYNWS